MLPELRLKLELLHCDASVLTPVIPRRNQLILLPHSCTCASRYSALSARPHVVLHGSTTPAAGRIRRGPRRCLAALYVRDDRSGGVLMGRLADHFPLWCRRACRDHVPGIRHVGVLRRSLLTLARIAESAAGMSAVLDRLDRRAWDRCRQLFYVTSGSVPQVAPASVLFIVASGPDGLAVHRQVKNV